MRMYGATFVGIEVFLLIFSPRKMLDHSMTFCVIKLSSLSITDPFNIIETASEFRRVAHHLVIRKVLHGAISSL